MYATHRKQEIPGYEAKPANKFASCTGCEFLRNADMCLKVSCAPWERNDAQYVIFVKKDAQNG